MNAPTTQAGSGATPGPWIVRPQAAHMSHNGDVGIVNDKGSLIAVALFERDHALDNANLIAAAPQMLEALRYAAKAGEFHGLELRCVHAAISAATGGSK